MILSVGLDDLPLLKLFMHFIISPSDIGAFRNWYGSWSKSVFMFLKWLYSSWIKSDGVSNCFGFRF
jgi:hypothetical protein